MPIASSDALTGFGVAPQLANLMGANANALTCLGTTSGTAATIKSRNSEMVTSASNTGGIIPSTIGIMEPYYITASQSNSAIIYLPAGHTFNISGAPTSVTLAQFKSIILWQYKPKNWCYVILA